MAYYIIKEKQLSQKEGKEEKIKDREKERKQKKNNLRTNIK